MASSPEQLARDHELCAIEALFRFQRNGGGTAQWRPKGRDGLT
jgi:hypothetical protein